MPNVLEVLGAPAGGIPWQPLLVYGFLYVGSLCGWEYFSRFLKMGRSPWNVPNSPWVSRHGHSWLGWFGCTHNHHVNIEFLYGGFRCCLSPNWSRLDILSPGDRETVWDGRLNHTFWTKAKGPPDLVALQEFLLFSHGFSRCSSMIFEWFWDTLSRDLTAHVIRDDVIQLLHHVAIRWTWTTWSSSSFYI